KRGSIKLPKEVVNHLAGANYVQIRLTSTGLTLTPVHISGLGKLSEIPKSLTDASCSVNRT
ncbi:hypothetical protein, partial [Cerasicoccus frondis]|uniref:hypothetical protein n=1 Tax=Cerasicoccus frondis TaxID=490090 RepID=UPI0028529E5C